ncbi:hypothetical protein ZOD2009_12532 [Haladaptatus paucihalophilus DX253]|uniref:Lipoprotein n=1 Tax=Haladaptatus paucihalophilus DX253 TaxID=797209 RepID=E7QUM2_HALPU|nr:hypothetical protein [Haladaptatus paucihalophilus]EFW91679.1 hypothetical protein ZOD2009_12532 [Haladaptatus paucihalophilus DX253]
MKLRSPAKVAALLLLVVSFSGCTGGNGDPTELATQTTNTATTAPTGTATTGLIYDLPLSSDELVDGNENALRAAGSFTAEEQFYLQSRNTDEYRWVNTTTRVNVEAGELRRSQNWSGTAGAQSIRTYVAPSGEGY